MSDNLEKQIEDILDYLSLCEGASEFARIPIGLKSTKGIRRLNPLTVNALSQEGGDLISGAIVSPYDYKDFTHFGSVSPSSEPDVRYSFWQIQKVDLKALRGMKLRSGMAYSLTGGTVDPQGVMRGSKTLWQWDGKEFVQEVDFAGWGCDFGEDPYRTQWRFSGALQLHSHSHSRWAVEIGYEGMPTIELWTDPQGAREVFRLRDVPAGKQRRAALRHWVTEHWRKKASGDGAVKVIEHLRGSEKFRWNGLICNIHPSRADLQRASDAKAKKGTP